MAGGEGVAGHEGRQKVRGVAGGEGGWQKVRGLVGHEGRQKVRGVGR